MRENTASKTRMLTYAALFVALTAVCSWISVPIPGTAVPINLATFAVLLSGVILGRKYGVLSMLTFLLLGAIGVPVFHSFTGGLAILTGPTGGFLVGYLALAFLAGCHRDLKVPFFLAALLGTIVLYACGVLWFVFLNGSTFAVALTACVLPFLPGDALKIVLVYLVKNRIRNAIDR